jgi:hypothetical protein
MCRRSSGRSSGGPQPPELRSAYPTRPQRYTGKGAAVRQIDHMTVATRDIMADVEWLRKTLGYRFMEWTAPDAAPDTAIFAMMTTNEKARDLGVLGDDSDIAGRIHHLAFWLDGRALPTSCSRPASRSNTAREGMAWVRWSTCISASPAASASS